MGRPHYFIYIYISSRRNALLTQPDAPITRGAAAPAPHSGPVQTKIKEKMDGMDRDFAPTPVGATVACTGGTQSSLDPQAPAAGEAAPNLISSRSQSTANDHVVCEPCSSNPSSRDGVHAVQPASVESVSSPDDVPFEPQVDNTPLRLRSARARPSKSKRVMSECTSATCTPPESEQEAEQRLSEQVEAAVHRQEARDAGLGLGRWHNQGCTLALSGPKKKWQPGKPRKMQRSITREPDGNSAADLDTRRRR